MVFHISSRLNKEFRWWRIFFSLYLIFCKKWVMKYKPISIEIFSISLRIIQVQETFARYCVNGVISQIQKNALKIIRCIYCCSSIEWKIKGFCLWRNIWANRNNCSRSSSFYLLLHLKENLNLYWIVLKGSLEYIIHSIEYSYHHLPMYTLTPPVNMNRENIIYFKLFSYLRN